MSNELEEPIPASGFTVTKRGYEIAEVDAYLAQQERNWQRRIATLQQEVKGMKDREEAIHLTLVAATKTKEEMLGSAQHILSEKTADAEAASARIIKEARFEAYKLVTDAKENAETALREAEIEAARLVKEARIEAATTLTSIEDETARLLSERESELHRTAMEFEERHSDLTSRVHVLATAAEGLEAQLRAIASGALTDLPDIVTELRKSMNLNRRRTDREEAEGRHSPEETPAAEPERGSYYRRRSAGLPHIGNAAAGSVISDISALRAKTFAVSEDEDAEELAQQLA